MSQFKLNSSNTFLVKSLPAGTYTVSEYGKNSDGSIPYYTRTSGASKTVTVTAGGTGTVTFTNTRNTGTGEVIKTWVDTNGNAISANGSTAKKSADIFPHQERRRQIYHRQRYEVQRNVFVYRNIDYSYIAVCKSRHGQVRCFGYANRQIYRV